MPFKAQEPEDVKHRVDDINSSGTFKPGNCLCDANPITTSATFPPFLQQNPSKTHTI
jgi:hypothetical protein